jgi:hypothetical protein
VLNTINATSFTREDLDNMLEHMRQEVQRNYTDRDIKWGTPQITPLGYGWSGHQRYNPVDEDQTSNNIHTIDIPGIPSVYILRQFLRRAPVCDSDGNRVEYCLFNFFVDEVTNKLLLLVRAAVIAGYTDVRLSTGHDGIVLTGDRWETDEEFGVRKDYELDKLISHIGVIRRRELIELARLKMKYELDGSNNYKW